MILKTAHMIRACQALGITPEDLELIPQPSMHMCMATALADELGSLTYEQARDILEPSVGPMLGEVVIEMCEDWRLLRLAPGVREVPGDGLLPIADQMVILQARRAAELEAGQQLEAQQQQSPPEGE